MIKRKEGLRSPDPLMQRNHVKQLFKDSDAEKFCPWCRKPKVQRTNISDFEVDE